MPLKCAMDKQLIISVNTVFNAPTTAVPTAPTTAASTAVFNAVPTAPTALPPAERLEKWFDVESNRSYRPHLKYATWRTYSEIDHINPGILKFILRNFLRLGCRF